MTDTEYITRKLTSEVELLRRHVLMLRITKENQPIGIIRLAEMMDLPKHKVRYSLRLLEEAGLIEPSTGGAKVTDGYDNFMKEIVTYLDSISVIIARAKRILGEQP
jgi:Uncharacterized protein conserved in archaea